MNKKNCLAESCFTPDASVEEIQAFFKQWSETYDTDLDPDVNWPAVPNVVKAFLDVCGKDNRNIRIIDLGAGTGMVAIELKKHGFTNIDALDGSKHMMEKCKKKDPNLYKEYFCDVVVAGKQLDYIPTGSYDGLISCGTITGGYVKADAFDEILRLVKQDGFICFTIRKNIYDEDEVYGYLTKFNELVNCGKWKEISREVKDYCSVALDVDRECYVCCYKVLKH